MDSERPAGALNRAWIVPPFTVLDVRQGYWRNRKRAWLDWGIDPAAGIADELVYHSDSSRPGFYQQKTALERTLGRPLTTAEFAPRYRRRPRERQSSAFDPVLAEVCYRWFCPPGGAVLDPFGGESVKGLVAAALGYGYAGVELRAAQVRANRRQAERLGLSPTWIRGDSAELDRLLPAGAEYDLVFTSPPYYDLESYQGGKRDGSGLGSYEQFRAWLAAILAAAAGRLRADRFCVVKVGEIRDRRGVLRNFVGDTVAMLQAAGLAYHNDAVLLTPLGSLPVRAGRAFAAGRKLGRAHQHVLCFYKGDVRQVGGTFGRQIEHGGPVNPS